MFLLPSHFYDIRRTMPFITALYLRSPPDFRFSLPSRRRGLPYLRVRSHCCGVFIYKTARSRFGAATPPDLPTLVCSTSVLPFLFPLPRITFVHQRHTVTLLVGRPLYGYSNLLTLQVWPAGGTDALLQTCLASLHLFLTHTMDACHFTG